MMKRVVNRILWIAAFLVTIGLLAWSNIEQANSHCAKIQVKMQSSKHLPLVSSEDIKTDVLEHMPALIGQSFKNITLQDLEKHVAANTQLKEVKAYLSLNGTIIIKTTPRKAEIRVFDEKGENLYIGSQEVIMKTSISQSRRIIVANGHIPHLTSEEKTQIANHEIELPTIYSQLYQLAKKIHEDAFLDALIDQIYVNKKQELILTPKVGVRKIFFGKAKNIDDKLFNLKVFYLNGKNIIDWQQYSSINVKYKNQIVCSKK